MLSDLRALLQCLKITIECPHCGHRSDRLAGELRSHGVYTCPGCGHTAMMDSSRIDRAVASAAEVLSERALDLGRAHEDRPAADGQRPWPALPRDDEPN